VDQFSADRSWVTFDPANCDQVSPVADRNSMPIAAHSPIDPCHDCSRARPRADP
jgi:hypothetical protein